MTKHKYSQPVKLLALAALLIGSLAARAEAPNAENILPSDTIAMMSIPDWPALCKIQSQSPQLQLWNDPLMKPFREHFVKRWNEEVVEPLQRELGLEFKDYQDLLQGQLTLALIQNEDADGNPQAETAFVLDAGDHQGQLTTNLTDLRRKWVAKGKSIRTENVRGVEFSIVELSTNDLPNTLRKFMPGASDVREFTGDDAEPLKSKPKTLFIGQSGSLLIMVDSLATARKIMNRLTGGSLPALAEVEQFYRDQGRLFRTAHAYGWVNARVITAMMEQNLTARGENIDQNAPDPLAQIKPGRVIAATGLAGLRSTAFAYTETPVGSEVTLFLGAPESERRGLFQILAGEAKDTLPPPFVPADAISYQRWRLDGQKTYAALEQMLQEISPQMLSGWNFILNTADLAARERAPDFNLRQQLMGNLGDDMITYKKAPRGTSPTDLENQPTLFLLGAKNGDQIIGALKLVMGMFPSDAPPSQREFLGTTITTFELPNPATEYDPAAAPSQLRVAFSRGYVAISEDDAILEEFLRSADSPVKPLRQLPGLAESTEVVTRPGTSLLSFEDQKAAMRLQLELLRQASTNSTPELQAPLTPIPESLGVGLPRNSLTDWFDFSLLPPFEQIEKYFYHTVYGGGGNAEGLTLRIFSPVPPQLRARAKPAE